MSVVFEAGYACGNLKRFFVRDAAFIADFLGEAGNAREGAWRGIGLIHYDNLRPYDSVTRLHS
ncbi:hypothetical protein CSC32_1502 [Pseudomonas aeruginosa]|nr:hypothetical protein CSC32_1502 [Pseudomonas aeruginosa]RCG86590.1 hypothetical protein CSB86_3227 [Pseudomonas aeruginosa]